MIFKSKKVLIPIGILLLIAISYIGFVSGTVYSHSFDFTPKLTIDGIFSTSVGIIGIITAAIVIPAIIQPMFSRQKSVNSFTRKNIEVILENIEAVLTALNDLYISKKPVNIAERKMFIDRYSRIINYAFIINKHSNDIPALGSFKEEIFDPLSNAKTGFAVDIVPKVVISETLYLSNKSILDSIIYKLIEIEYDI